MASDKAATLQSINSDKGLLEVSFSPPQRTDTEDEGFRLALSEAALNVRLALKLLQPNDGSPHSTQDHSRRVTLPSIPKSSDRGTLAEGPEDFEIRYNDDKLGFSAISHILPLGSAREKGNTNGVSDSVNSINTTPKAPLSPGQDCIAAKARKTLGMTESEENAIISGDSPISPKTFPTPESHSSSLKNFITPTLRKIGSQMTLSRRRTSPKLGSSLPSESLAEGSPRPAPSDFDSGSVLNHRRRHNFQPLSCITDAVDFSIQPDQDIMMRATETEELPRSIEDSFEESAPGSVTGDSLITLSALDTTAECEILPIRRLASKMALQYGLSTEKPPLFYLPGQDSPPPVKTPSSSTRKAKALTIISDYATLTNSPPPVPYDHPLYREPEAAFVVRNQYPLMTTTSSSSAIKRYASDIRQFSATAELFPADFRKKKMTFRDALGMSPSSAPADSTKTFLGNSHLSSSRLFGNSSTTSISQASTVTTTPATKHACGSIKAYVDWQGMSDSIDGSSNVDFRSEDTSGDSMRKATLNKQTGVATDDSQGSGGKSASPWGSLIFRGKDKIKREGSSGSALTKTDSDKSKRSSNEKTSEEKSPTSIESEVEYLERRLRWRLNSPNSDYNPRDFRLYPRHPTTGRAWGSRNLRCTTCRPELCAVCGCSCCVYSALRARLGMIPPSSAKMETYKYKMEIEQIFPTGGKEAPTFIQCTKGGGCGKLVCPDCCGVCPIFGCEDTQCRRCKDGDPWNPCKWHDEWGMRRSSYISAIDIQTPEERPGRRWYEQMEAGKKYATKIKDFELRDFGVLKSSAWK